MKIQKIFNNNKEGNQNIYMFLNIQKLLYFFMDSFEVLNVVLFCCLGILLCMAKMSDKLSIELKS